MIAKEMFEELGYDLDEENDKEILYKMKWEISSTYYVSFDLKNKNIECYYFASDSPFTPAESFAVDLDLLQAINKQIEELGWLTPTLEMNDITISGDQFLKNIQRMSDAYPTIKEQINKINDAVKRAKGSDK